MKQRKVTIVFLCIGNACRSQMAEAFARYFSSRQFDDMFEIHSAGTHPGIGIPQEVYEVMGEKGISLEDQVPKRIESLPISRADIVVTMGCEVQCPTFPFNRLVELNIQDPIGASMDVYREVRDQVHREVFDILRGIFEENNTPNNV